MALNPSKRPFSAFVEPNGFSSASEPTFSKKPRSDNPVLDKVSLWNMITALPTATTQTILFQVCHDNPSLSHHVQSAHNERLAAERAKPAVNFDAESRSCWYTLNKKYKGGSKQYDAIAEICDELESVRTSILEQAHANTKWETRRNALEVLRKISKSIMLCNEQVIKHELMKDGLELGYFAEAMVELARGMTEEERERYKEERLYEKLVELQTACDWEVDMEGLRDVYEIFDGEDNGEGGEEDDGEGRVDVADRGGEDEGSDDSVLIVSAPQRTKVFSISEMA
jgi:hypothetical protein